MHDLMVKHARTAFEPLHYARCLDQGGLFLVLLYGRIAIRFKKLDEEFRASSIPTQQSLGFERQQTELPGVKTLMTLQAGYQLNATHTDIASLCLACPNGHGNHWILPLNIAAGCNVVDLPLSSAAPTTSIRLKSLGKADDTGENVGL